jgi:hypothetical protein
MMAVVFLPAFANTRLNPKAPHATVMATAHWMDVAARAIRNMIVPPVAIQHFRMLMNVVLLTDLPAWTPLLMTVMNLLILILQKRANRVAFAAPSRLWTP